MITLDELGEFAKGLDGVEETDRRGQRVWSVGGKSFAWERPFSKADVKRFGDLPVPQGDIVAIATEDLHEKEAVLAAGHPGVFTIEHFNGYAAVLVQLRAVHKKVVRALLTDGWRAKNPATAGPPRRPARRRAGPSAH